MRVAVRKWGNSLALRIPKALATGSRIKQGSVVEVSVIRGKLVVTPVAGREFALGQLLKRVNARNRHGEIVMGLPAGREAW
ncbi:MAG TPA: AbrB/MazE/SpoVT family DNA-binding domain-containing protein [bacterium]|nr:AbrB/MazE/SpoVT family DNA-binding domain-containing protein [bacterium]